MKLKSKVMIRFSLTLIFKIIFFEMMLFLYQIYTSYIDLVKLFCDCNITVNGIASILVLLVLFAMIIQKIIIEMRKRVDNIFKNIQKGVNLGSFFFPGNIPITEEKYKIAIEEIIYKMKEYKIVNLYFFNDNSLRNYIISQFEEVFKNKNKRPI